VSKPVLDGASSSATGSAKSLIKGIALIDLIASSEVPLRQTELSKASGLPRPTAVRLLDVLCHADLLRLDPAGGYVLGPRLARWGQAFLDGLDVRRHATDLVQRLVDLSNETSFLGVLDHTSVLYIAAVNSPQPVRPAARVGSRNPLHSTAIGKALLAARTAEERDALLVAPLERRTPNTIVDRSELDAHLAEVRERGFAIDEIENEEGVRCVAAPVRDHQGTTIAAISVSAPAYRFSLDDLLRLAPEVVRATHELSARLGSADPVPADDPSGDRCPEPREWSCNDQSRR
jgi:IclR family acetate operon transcriptional repressor